MSRSEDYELALRVLHRNLVGQGLDSLKDISARQAMRMAQYIELILGGLTPTEASQQMED